MRQVLLNSRGAIVARMPRPALGAGEVLVRVHYSLISTGTELASLRPGLEAGADVAAISNSARTAARYLGKAIRNPRKALQRANAIARRVIGESIPRTRTQPARAIAVAGFTWQQCGAIAFTAASDRLDLTSDETEFGYQAMSNPIAVAPGSVPVFELEGHVESGTAAIGLLDEGRTAWLGTRNFEKGPISDRLIFNPGASQTVTLVIANAGARINSRIVLSSVRVQMAPSIEQGLPQSELDDQGWNVGYSVAGEVIAIGDEVEGLVPGDIVACAGAGKANHADFVSVPRNLCCKVPVGCDASIAATTTVGAIALQGVRRAAPQLGETVCVLGLGLIGQIAAQLLRANGTSVLGFDLDFQRVGRAIQNGMDAGAADVEGFKQLVRDRTGGRGSDRVLITAATKSDAVINLAMDVARPKGSVVIVGDVGLNVQRAAFYRKEIDLLMSTSYGPGRYDTRYEEDGQDYPFGYVRWTLNRNMQAYLELIASGRIRIEPLIEKIVGIDEAPTAYKALASGEGPPPLGVLIRYPADARKLSESADSTRIAVRGARKPPAGVLRYALVGVGAFGTAMLVPQMAKRKDRFFLRGVVSRNTTTGGNFARANQVEVLATEIDAVLSDPDFDLVVIATRHYEHADQVTKALLAGKHVFVEKPLAINWKDLDRVVDCYDGLTDKPMLMVGFNRRFSPAIQHLGKVLAGRRSPIMVNYRLNAGYIPLDHWVHGADGGGRNVGEACHMYDVFRYLAGAPVASIAARAIDPSNLPYYRSDNFSATLAYEDGSVGTLLYTALGPKQGLPKERIEVFCDGEAYIVDDFKSLIRASTNEVLWEGEVDKGHYEELSRLGDAIATGSEPPIPVQEIFETSAVGLRIEDLLHGRAEDGQA